MIKLKLNENIDKNSTKYRDYLMKKGALCKIVAFLVVIVIGAIVSLIIPLRPTVSENEKRNLATFPEVSTESFLDGSFFSGIDTWFSDTFPGRDGLVYASELMSSLYGFRGTVVSGAVTVGDDIPDVDIDESSLDVFSGNTMVNGNTVTADESSKEENETGSAGTDSASGSSADASGKSVANYSYNNSTIVMADEVGTDVEDLDGTTAAAAGESLGSIFAVGDSAYNYYGFSQETSDAYVSTINNFADRVSGKATVYDLIVPTSIDITLDDATRNTVSSSNQKKAMLYMYSHMNANVGKCYIYDLMKSHRDEYIYFRTDHHWTALGAYYAYTALMAQLGKTALPLESYEEVNCGEYKGSLATMTGLPSLAANPDNLVAYKAPSTNHCEFVNHDKVLTDYNVVTDVSGWANTSKYSAFIGGDNLITFINNPNLTDGGNCLVIKESFGNAMIPFMVENFSNIIVVDYRYYEGSLYDLVVENGIDTVVFINNIQATSTDVRVDEIRNLCEK